MSDSSEAIKKRFLSMSPAETGISASLLGFTDEQADQLHRFKSEGDVSRGTIDRTLFMQMLKAVPGADPVIAAADKKPELIPEAGWLIAAKIAPGNSGVVDTYHYSKKGLEIRSVEDGREKYKSARMYVALGAGSLSHTIAYENPAYPYRDTEPYNRMGGHTYTGLSFANTSLINLVNGGRLLDQKEAFEVNLFTSLDYVDLDDPVKQEHAPTIDINRVTAQPDEVLAIFGHLALGMGLDAADTKTFVTAAAAKVL